MNIIKLNAINSTNDYLKQMAAQYAVENFTVVVAEHQTAGKGQMGAEWVVPAGKNLTFSVFFKESGFDIGQIFTLNVAVAVSILQGLKMFKIPNLSIKWPNDILAGGKKLCGILIENTIGQNGIQSIIGIGINVNQTNFGSLSKAISLAIVMGKEFDKDAIMKAICERLEANLNLINTNPEYFWQEYHNNLFKKDMPMPFEKEGKRFMGIIKGVLPNGRLQILLEDDTLQDFGIKEVAMLY